jgi:hypothetical protein
MTTTMDSVAMVGGLAARFDDRPACDCFALAPSRLVAALGNLAHVVAGVADAHGSAAHPRRTAQTRVQATVSRYMPRRSYPPTQRWRTFLRSQALGIGMIGFGEAGRVSAQLLALVRGRRRVRRHQGGGWHLLQAYRATVHLAPVEAISLFQWY